MPIIECSEDHANRMRRVCQSLLETDDPDYHQHFTGVGYDYDLWCESCEEKQQQEEQHVALICVDCQETLRAEGYWFGASGRPQVAVRPSSLTFVHQAFAIPELQGEMVLDMQPMNHLPTCTWLGLTRSGKLFRLMFSPATSYTFEVLFKSPNVNLRKPVSLSLSPSGRWVAMVNTYGQNGVVINLETRRIQRQLQRDGHCIGVSPFPIAFFTWEGQELLIHATQWNRLDISDPQTGNCLTPRTVAPYLLVEQRPAHYLDYFHGRLSVSPNQEWIADNGWVWHPIGVVSTWNLRHWVKNNVWESEDGPSKKGLCARDYFWDSPLCWIDQKTLAIWGYGNDDEWLIPAVRLFDVGTGQELRWFAGPEIQAKTDDVWKRRPFHSLAFDEYLFSFSELSGTAVWDIQTGARLLLESDFYPTTYHHGAKRFLCQRPKGEFVLSQLVNSDDEQQLEHKIA